MPKKYIDLQKEDDNLINNLATPIPSIDESIYHEPYLVKDGCLCERKIVRQQEIELKLADFVPVLKAVITLDDGIEQKNCSEFLQHTKQECRCRSRLSPQTRCKV